jgi:putative two-component system response regulator
MHKDRLSVWLSWIAALICLIAPVAIGVAAPRFLTWGGGAVLYLTLVPAFVIPYGYEWRGAVFSLVAGEMALFMSALLMMAQGISPGGVIMPVSLTLFVVSVGAGRVTTLLHRSRAESERKALSDPGTGLPNRRHALIHLKRGFAAASRGGMLAVVAFDLDRFKRINDQHGHATGDQVLATFARILRARTREMNLSGRLGGEEFIAILENTGLEGAVTFAEDVRMALEVTPFPFGSVTVSAGVAAHEKGMASPDVLRAAADQALYMAKLRGRNQVAVVGSVPSRGKYDPVEIAPQHAQYGKGERLLVVERDRGTRQSLSSALRRTGFEIIEADSPDQAIRIARGLGTPPDAVITDLVMPSMTGYHLVEELNNAGASMRALYLASHLPDQKGDDGEDIEVRQILRRPVALDDLAQAVRRLLDAPVGRAGLAEAALQNGSGHRAASSRRIHVMLSTERVVVGLAARLRHLGYDDVVEIRGGVAPAEDPPGLVIAFLSDPVERKLLSLNTYLSRWPKEEMPGVLLLSPGISSAVAPRLTTLFPALLLRPDARLEELDRTVRHLLDVHSLRDRYLREQGGMEAQVAARSAELESQKRDLLLRLARVAELRDDLTGKHTERVGWLSGRIAAEMGLPAETVELIMNAAPLHDLGKISTPDAILNKPDALTHIEQELIRRHTEIGARLLSGSNHRLLQEAERIARSHHERWDGSGYPDGLIGQEIPISARIVAAADAYDCITHARSYREAFTSERAVKIITGDAGSHFDPAVAEVLAMLADGRELEPDQRPPLLRPIHAIA